jgi:hypothetical protein
MHSRLLTIDFGVLDYLKKAAAEVGDRGLDTRRELRGLMHHGPMEKTSEQKAQSLAPAQQPLSSTNSRPCERCGRVMSQRIPGGLRCMQCGKQRQHPECRPKVHHMNRADIFSRRPRFR